MTGAPAALAALQDAIRAHRAIVVRGGGTKSAAPREGAALVDLAPLSGITEYTPDECVFTALAGTPLRDIVERLAAHGQYLPFDPPLVNAGATIGGTVAAGMSGPGRYRYGGVRDFLIGARIVDGRGTVIRSGGKVVKNAAGFLLHHGLVGSRGRFGAIAELTFKVFPAPEARATVHAACGSAAAAFAAVRRLEQERVELDAVDFTDDGRLWVRVAGRAATLAARVARLQRALDADIVLDAAAGDRVWEEAREFAWADAAHSVVKVPVTSQLAIDAAVRYSCGGSVAWVATAEPEALAGVRGQIVRGPRAGAFVGDHPANVFEDRVRQVLDPEHRFSAASHSGR